MHRGAVQGEEMKLIGVSGQLESGKDTVADILVNNHGYKRVSVGYHIRMECINLTKNELLELGTHMPKLVLDTARDLCNLTPSHASKLVFAKPTEHVIRVLLQWYGQWKYEEDNDYWLNRVRYQIRVMQMANEGIRIVMSDVRRFNEFEMCRNHGETWCVVRAKSLAEPTTQQAREALGHVTEMGWKALPFKQYISNNGSLDDLSKLVGMIVKEYDL